MPELHDPHAAASAPTRPPRHLKLAGAIALSVALVVVAVGLISRTTASAKLKDWTNDQATPTVSLAAITGGGGSDKLVLPGQVEAFNTADVNARVSGYLKTWTVDIGSRVRAGQTLAVLDAPELNQQLIQAQADLATAQANARLAATTNTRWQQLLKDEAASKQEADEKAGDLAAKTTLVAAAQANVRRVAETYGFTNITAPFDGVVTARNAQIGQLVSAGVPAQPLFMVADDRRLRIYVRVPQAYVAQLHTGQTADLTVPEYPERTFKATLARTSEAIDRASGALTAELQIDNGDHSLKPGSYATASFPLTASTQSVNLPSSALMFRTAGTMVGVVGPDGRAHLRKVMIARDMGATVEIGAGISAKDRIIDNPADTLVEGQLVRVAPAAAPAPAPHG